MTTDNDYPVIIVGGGPCGLLSSLLLARFGVKNIVLERHPDISIHPKAMALTRRTGEVFAQLGLYERMSAADVTTDEYALSAWCRSLSGEILGTSPMVEDAEAFTPCVRLHCPQPHVEAVLAREINQHPLAEIKHYCQVESVEETSGGVTVTYTDRATEEARTLTTDYLIASDGAKSRIRDMLGIEADGPGDLGHFINIYFRANYGPRLEERRAILYQSIGESFFETFVSVNGQDLWLMHHYLEEGESIADYPESRVIDLVRKSSGMPEVPVEIISELPWVMSPKVAREWRKGRCFLVGDSAARLSPTGGLGMNTGLQGAHNLAWKLAAVVNGLAGEALLDTYQAERKPVAEFTSGNSNANFQELYNIVASAMEGRWDDTRQLIANSRRAGSILGQDLGMTYDSTAITSDETPAPAPEDPINDYAPSGRPGGRAPYLRLKSEGQPS
ncbi:MAG: FAD-dependent monooxygenase, partial [Puniceicoccales bacterium]